MRVLYYMEMGGFVTTDNRQRQLERHWRCRLSVVTKCSPNLPDLSEESVTMSQRNPRFPWLPRIRGEWERGIRGFRGFKKFVTNADFVT